MIRLYEEPQGFHPAQKNVEALYHDNPKILGVVRSTADFYWRMKMQPQAITVLLQAAKDAYPALSTQFTMKLRASRNRRKAIPASPRSVNRVAEKLSLQRRVPRRHG